MPNVSEAAVRNVISAALNMASATLGTTIPSLEALQDLLQQTNRELNHNSQNCGCSQVFVTPIVEFNKEHTLYKADFPGFTKDSLTVHIRALSDRDQIIVTAANEFRPPKNVTVDFTKNRIDRDSIKCQLRYGVLKITGRTYKSVTPINLMKLDARDYKPVMLN